MFLKLLKLEWKAFFRSASFGRSMALKLVMGFLGLYFILMFLGFGIGLYYYVEKEFKSEEPIFLINNYLLYWFLGELVVRFLLQNLPTIRVKPFLTQSISRNVIIHFLLFKSFCSFFNLLSLVVILPFALVCLMEADYSVIQLLFWFFAVMSSVLAVNYLNIWIQKQFISGVKTLLPFVIVVLLLVGLDYFGIYSVSTIIGSFFTSIFTYPFLGIIPILLAIFSYWLVFKNLKNNLYLDAYLNDKTNQNELSELNWVDRFGKLAPFIRLDLKLIMRNKRTKNTVFISLFFCFYGLIFYNNPSYGNLMMVFVGILMTGIFIINFGQFIPAWDSVYFPLLRTRAISAERYLQAKILLLYVSVFILTILSCGYVYFGVDKLYVNLACGIYNMGINIPIILAFGAYNKKRIDLSQGSMFNYQGTGLAQWLVSIPIMLFPSMIWGATEFILDQKAANIVLVVLGLIGLLFHKFLIQGIAQLYERNHYKMIEGFRQKN